MKFVSIPIFIGVVSGSLSSAFLYLLNMVTVLRESHPVFLYFLPLFGLLYYLVIKNIPYHIHQGEQLIIEAIMDFRADGLTLREIAHRLTALNIPTKNGKKKWHPMMVKRIIDLF